MLSYDDTNLRRLFDALSEKEQIRALRGALFRQVGRLRSQVAALMRSELHNRSGEDFKKGVKSKVYKKTCVGYSVSLGTRRAGKNGKGESGMHTNRYGKKKPVFLWANLGTSNRRTRKKGRARGHIAPHRFIDRAASTHLPSAGDTLKQSIIDNIQRIARKHGCL